MVFSNGLSSLYWLSLIFFFLGQLLKSENIHLTKNSKTINTTRHRRAINFFFSIDTKYSALLYEVNRENYVRLGIAIQIWLEATSSKGKLSTAVIVGLSPLNHSRNTYIYSCVSDLNFERDNSFSAMSESRVAFYVSSLHQAVVEEK